MLAQDAHVFGQGVGDAEVDWWRVPQRRDIARWRIDRQLGAGKVFLFLLDDLHSDFPAMGRLGVAGSEHAVFTLLSTSIWWLRQSLQE